MSAALERVKAVLLSEVGGTVVGKALVDECTRIQLELSRADSEPSSVPELVWHYLLDADIRIRDAGYASAQLEAMKALFDL